MEVLIMRKKLIEFLALLLFVSAAGCANQGESALYTAGTYESAVFGMNGDVEVKVEFSDSEILSVEATGDKETPGIGDAAIKELPAVILEAQSADVDVVAGSTVTSNALLAAVQNCIDKAMGVEKEDEAIANTTADVIVVGAGAAGLAAAATAKEAGADVIILEVNSHVGGAAATSMGNILRQDEAVLAEQERNDGALEVYSTYDPDFFPGQWREDYDTLMTQIEEYKKNGQEKGAFSSIERIMVDHYMKGHGVDNEGTVVTLDYDLIRSAVENNMVIYNWLTDNGLGTTPWKDYAITPEGQGSGLIEVLAKATEGCDIHYGMRGQELVVTDGKVTGVIAIDTSGNEVTYTANQGVVIATGGFSSNPEMVAQYQKLGTGLDNTIPSNDPASIRGDGIVMAEAIGA